MTTNPNMLLHTKTRATEVTPKAGTWTSTNQRCSRRWGRSTISAAKTLDTALTRAGSLILVASRTARQSGLSVHKVPASSTNSESVPAAPTVPCPFSCPTNLASSDSPAYPENIRGYSAAKLVIDEAARVSDNLYYP